MSSTGKEPNIISYRKQSNVDEKPIPKTESKFTKKTRQASAKVHSNIRKLVTSQPKLKANIDLYPAIGSA